MKMERRSKIIELINKYQIETQEELGERLEKAGFPVTQATISRDIRELKLVKGRDENGNIIIYSFRRRRQTSITNI